MTTLSAARRREFERTGFLVFEDAFEEALVTEARERLREAMPEDPADPASLRARDGDHDEILNRTSGSETGERLGDVTPFEELFRAVYPYAEELVGEGVLAAPDERPAEYCLHGGHLLASREDGDPVVEHEGALGPILQYPDDVGDTPDAAFDPRRAWHVDGGTGPYAVGADVDYLPFALGVAVYFDRVEPRGGGFTVWPGSHRLTERYFADHSYGDYVGADRNVLAALDPGPGFEITGGPGTLVLWHHNLIHGAGPNHGERVRMAGFQRIAHRNADEIGQSALGDIWRQYPAIRDSEPADREHD
jgi:hypothetical protein